MSQGRGAPPPLLEFRDVSIVRGRQPILQSVSLVIPVGQNVAILGPNGAGKSSLIKSVTRQYYPPARPGRILSSGFGGRTAGMSLVCGPGWALSPMTCNISAPGRSRGTI